MHVIHPSLLTAAESPRPSPRHLTAAENARYLAECEVRLARMKAEIAREFGAYRTVHFDHAEPVARIGDV